MIATPRQLFMAFPHRFTSGRPPLVARGWFALVVELCTGVDRVVDPQTGAFHWVRFGEKHGALQTSWEADRLTPTQRAQVEALVKQAELASAGTCVRCGQPGQLHAHMDYLLPLCAKHARTRHAGLWMTIPWPGYRPVLR